jgi:hypothetical protein
VREAKEVPFFDICSHFIVVLHFGTGNRASFFFFKEALAHLLPFSSHTHTNCKLDPSRENQKASTQQTQEPTPHDSANQTQKKPKELLPKERQQLFNGNAKVGDSCFLTFPFSSHFQTQRKSDNQQRHKRK